MCICFSKCMLRYTAFLPGEDERSGCFNFSYNYLMYASYQSEECYHT